ncbi:MAG: hypothetical protein AB7V50_09695 [Vampirovibrionia bacterium]
MIVFNYNKLLRHFEPIILLYARKISFGNYEDHAQYIRLFIYNHLNKFDPVQSSLKYYVHLIIKTAYRRIVFDKKKQEIFEDDFCKLCDDVPITIKTDTYYEFLSDIVLALNDETDVSIFYAILYNKEDKNYTQISKMLNMDYNLFLNKVKHIRKIVSVVLNDKYF